MGKLADKRLGDVLPTIDAYRPVALTVAAILGLVVIVPGAGGDSARSFQEFGSSQANATATTVPSTPPTTTAASTAEPSTPTTVPAGGDPIAPPSTGARADPPPTSGPTPTASPTTTAVPSAPPAAGTSDDGEPQPLRIAASGWATATAGVPLDGTPADDVPEGTLPVGTRVGQTDKMAFIRLTGDEMTLVLAEDAAGRRGNAFEVPPVEVCQITESGWEPGEGQEMADAPEYDADNCVAAQRNPDRTWSVSLFLFDDPADDRGFALVPSADAPLDFQVTFADQAIG